MGRIRNAILDRQYELEEEETAKKEECYMSSIETINEKLDAIQQSIKCLEILLEQNQKQKRFKIKQTTFLVGGIAVIIGLLYWKKEMDLYSNQI